MIFQSKEEVCLIEVLRLLSKGGSKYSTMFKKTKVSHTTLQRVLRFLIEGKFIKKHDTGHMKVDYEITSKGSKLLEKLGELKEILR